MAELIYNVGLPTSGSPTRPFDGHLDLDMGRNVSWGTGHFSTTDTTATIQPTQGKKIAAVFLTPVTAGVVGLSYAVNATTGVITVTRTDTTSGGSIAFLIIYA